MKTTLIAATSNEQLMTREQALQFGGHMAAICYMPKDIASIMNEDSAKTEKRIKDTLMKGHHSVYEHAFFTVYLENIPKILAMILNNESTYTTSEKSARYTTMQTSGREEELYKKWIDIFKHVIQEKYGAFSKMEIETKAKENARYLISVFTPATNMAYTTSFRQWNYILHWCENYINQEPDNDFSVKVKKVLKEFITQMGWIYVRDLNIAPKTKGLSLFYNDYYSDEEWGWNYSTVYAGSMAQLGQAQRHRAIKYKMLLSDIAHYYIPSIIRNTEYEKMWRKDIAELGENYPQGRLVTIWERGTYESFMLKCEDRLCSRAQLEIATQTWKTLQKYLKGTRWNNLYVYEQLEPYAKGPRCFLPNWKCKEPCGNVKSAIKRDI